MENQIIVGIDISKLTFDVLDHNGDHKVYAQEIQGFKALYNSIPKSAICVMEATGIYHLQLATYLHQKGIKVAVINPLRIKRFIQMHLKRNKTDKSDAAMIRLYGMTQSIEVWEPMEAELEQCKDTYQTMEQFINIRASLKNKLEELKTKKSAKYLIQTIEIQIDTLTNTITELECKITELIKVKHATLYSNLKSIKGIGTRTASLLLISSDGFKQFDSAKQLASYYGLAPCERSSGSSLNAKARISKRGNPLVRKKLYMCSLQASRYNPTCKALYERLVAKGKPKKLALIAVANKLLRISFAIAKSQIPYDPEYRSYRKSA